MSRSARSAATALAALLLAGAWLRLGVGFAGSLVEGTAPIRAELGFTVLVYLPLALLALAGGAAADIRVTALGRNPRAAVARGVLVGASGLALAVGYAALAGTLHPAAGGGAGAAVLLGLAAVLVQVTAEEWLFRGLIQPAAATVAGPTAGIGLAAAAFAALHVVAGAGGGLQVTNLFAGGLLFGLLARADGGTAGAIAAHAAWNAGEQLLLGLDPNPGVGGFGSLFDLDLTGAAQWGGSPDGLNASIGMAFALAALIVPLAFARYAARR